jgi:hypothetical protein
MYEHIVTQLNFLMDALDNLSNGLVSHKLITPEMFTTVLDQIRSDIQDYYPEYELVMNSVQEYYDLPLTKFQYHKNQIVIQVPLYIRHYQQNPLDVYNLQTVHVPYNMNQKLKVDNPSPAPYTKLTPKSNLLAMSYSTYISLNYDQLHNCYHFGDLYLCQQTLLTQHSSKHTCESAIFYKLPHEVIQSLCNFTYFPNLIPPARLLDSGTEVLLSNIPLPWTFYCAQERKVPNTIVGGSYVKILKESLCQCSIGAGQYYIYENIASCPNNTSSRLKLTYTVNQAVLPHLSHLPPGLDLNSDIEGDLPFDLKARIPRIYEAKSPDVLPQKVQVPGTALRAIIPAIKSNLVVYKTKGDKALHLDDDKTSSFWTVLRWIIAALVLGILLLLPLIYCQGSMKMKTYVLKKLGRRRKSSMLPRFSFRVRRKRSIPEEPGIEMHEFTRPPPATPITTAPMRNVSVVSSSPPCDICGATTFHGGCPVCHGAPRPTAPLYAVSNA